MGKHALAPTTRTPKHAGGYDTRRELDALLDELVALLERIAKK